MVSIIVPVYNGEDHLEKCVRSILAQTEKKLQLILVNDGSVDGTGWLCDRLAAEDGRVTVIHQSNAGVSAARNAGLDAAKGEYIGFVDADDWIAPDTYEQALAAMGSCDMVMWDAVTVWPDGRRSPDTIPLLEGDRVIEKKDWTPALLRQMAGAVWRCLYRAELIADVRFPVGIKLSEDRLFNLNAMGKAEKLNYLKRGLYFRYVREGSACNSYHHDLLERNVQVNLLAQQYLKQYWNEDYYPVYTETFLVEGALNAVYQTCAKKSPHKSIKQRLTRIRSITGNQALIAAFDSCAPQGLQQKLLHKKANMLLLLAAAAYHLKHGR